MLESLRNSVNSWTAKGLLALLVLSFAVFGISDVFTNRVATVVATVGESEVTTEEFANALSNDIQSLQSRARRTISISEARQLGRDQIVLARLSTRKALNAEAEALGLSAPPAAIRKAIETAPVFMGPDGTFNRFSYETALRREGLTPGEYEDGVRQDLARDAMLQAVGAGTSAPRALAEALHRHRNEQRILDYVILSKSDAEDPGEPADEQISAFHEENADRFSAPDYRSLSWVVLTPESMAESIEINEDRIVEAYGSRIAEFTLPETRTLDQLLFDSEDEAKDAKQRIDDGTAFARVVEERGANKQDVSLGTVQRGELPGDLDDAAFGATEPGVFGPVKTAFGWTLLDIRSVRLETVTPLEDVRETIRLDLAMTEARDTILEESVAMDDEIAGGATLEEVADRTAALYVTVDAIDSTGRDPKGDTIADLPAIPGFLNAAFEAEEGVEPVLVEADGGGYYALSVNGITPAALRPLDDVRDDVIAAWKDAQRTEAMAELAGEMRAQLEEGATLAAVAAEQEKDVVTSPAVRRSDQISPLTSEIVQSLFRADPGAVVGGEAGDGYLIGTLKEVVANDAEVEQAAVDSTAERYSSQFATDVVQTFSRDAVARHPLHVYPGAIDETLAYLGQRY